MKKKDFLWSLLALLLPTALSVGLASCGGDDDPTPDPQPTPVAFTVSPSEINLSSNAGAQGSIAIVCTEAWTASCSETWVSLSLTSGTGAGAISVTASTENPNSSERTATINVKSGSETKYVTVKQAAQEILILSGLDAPFDAEAGNTQTAQELTIDCNGAWTLEGKPEWLDISALSGNNKSTIKVWPNSANNSTSERSAVLTVKAGSKTATKTVRQRAGLNKNLSVSPKTTVTLADGFAFDFEFGSAVAYYYVKLYNPSTIERLTDAEIIADMSSDISNRDTPSDGYVTSWQNLSPSTEYIACTVGFDKDGTSGKLEKTSLRTKSATNQAIAIISDVKYTDTKWEWTTTTNGYVTRYYMWFNTNPYLYDTTNAAIAWFFQQEMKNYPDNYQPIAQGDIWQRNRNGGTIFDVITWALDVDGNFSGVIDRFLGSIESNIRQVTSKSRKEEDCFKKYKTIKK